MSADNNLKFAELNVEVVDTWRRHPNTQSGNYHYWLYFAENRIGGDTDDEYPVDQKDMGELIDSINKHQKSYVGDPVCEYFMKKRDEGKHYRVAMFAAF